MSKADSVDATTAPGTFDTRAVKALTEAMTVLDNALDHDLRDEEFVVVTPTGTYTVDAIAETCDCPDALHRGVRCKHQRRVDYARGAVPIPGWANREAIDPQLGQHLSASPRIATADGRTEVLE
ncbi:hypothetical protein DJ73_13075 [Halorubrum sp. Ea1]|uniref:hypothetical protein n=1 Tax=Halorubrum sp. Ea1 TaxID=1480718 RepID=UPI000B990232|nr:hypothetical protein [Halorubrum sp. Ea1]OYR51532.1 hypothetical protein DJ73_13075 [Halorubrum sp. Ea1]